VTRPGGESQRLRAELLAAASEAAPLEACGLILRRDGRTWLQSLPNQSPTPKVAFAVDPLAVLAAENDGCDVVGVWHSHPGGSAQPSAADHDGAAAWPGLAFWIAGLHPPSATRWIATEGGLRADPAGPVW